MLDNELILRRELETEASEKLRVMLRLETEKDVPDDDLVLTILHILEEREPETLEPASPREAAAWELFRKRVRARRKRRKWLSGSLMKVASILLVAGLLFIMVPQQAEADHWWQRLTKWTDEFFGFFREEDTFRLEDYEFQTDNPGLQQVYDAVVELGVTIPAVPMWLPEGYELAECTVVESPAKQYVYARFLVHEKECILQINVLNLEAAKDYFKNEASVEKYEVGGMVHSIVRNMERWAVSWTKDNVECFFTIDCSEDVLYEIIQSIYRWRMNE